MSAIDQTAEQVFESVTGFDELSVAQHFGHTILELGEKNPSMFGRALIFVVLRRRGEPDDAARNQALEMPFKEVNDFFAAESAEEAGKDERPEPLPESSLTSVS